MSSTQVTGLKTISEPSLVPLPPVGNLSDHVEHNAHQFPSAPVVSVQEEKIWRDISSLEFQTQVRNIAKGLIAEGIEPGQRIAIFSRTNYQWTLADYAIWYAGAVSVPIYETSSPEQIEWMMTDSGVVATFFETRRNVQTFESVSANVPHMTRSYVFNENVIDDLALKGLSITDGQLDERRKLNTHEDIATIIYTSGTTGRPKGCMLTHGNLMSESDNLIAGIPEIFAVPGASTLLFLPLAHVFGRMIEVAMIRSRVTIGHCPNPAFLLQEMGSFKPTFLLAVPRVFEKVFNGASSKAHNAGKLKGAIFDRATSIAIKYSEAISVGQIPISLRMQHGFYDRLVYSKLRTAMGGRVTHAISGGASLGERLGHYFRGLGLMVLEGYGLTETTAGTSLNIPGAIKIGSVGRPVFGTSIRIAEDGEIELTGAHIFKGYWQNAQATADTFTKDGWLQTGDIGHLDQDGFLYITGRKKEILVTNGGKNVAPAVLEDRLRANPIISQCVVVGDARPFIAALITLDTDALPGILASHGIEMGSLEDLVNDKRVREIVQGVVNVANEAVSNSEAIKKFVILPTDFTIDNGYLTPKMSIKRHLVTSDFADQIASLYK